MPNAPHVHAAEASQQWHKTPPEWGPYTQAYTCTYTARLQSMSLSQNKHQIIATLAQTPHPHPQAETPCFSHTDTLSQLWAASDGRSNRYLDMIHVPTSVMRAQMSCIVSAMIPSP